MEKQEVIQKLQKLTLPTSKISLQTQILGCFACPDEWKSTDQANPNMFTYTARFMTQQFNTGKIQPRQLTDKEIREQEQLSKKKPAANKKQTKDPAEEQRIRKIKQEEAEAEAKRQEEQAQLSEQQRFNRVSEDPYRAFNLKFENKTTKAELDGKLLIVFEERVQKDGGEWLYLYKYPSLGEQELAKLRKGKPKNLNVNDLNPVTMRTWVDLSSLSKPNQTELTLRCKLSQVDETPQTSKPNLEKTYALIKFKLSSPLEVEPTSGEKIESSDLIRPYPAKPAPPLDVEAVRSLQEQIKVILESLAMEFSQTNSQQLNSESQQKVSNCFSQTSEADTKKRSEQFLYEFNIRGMYRVMKQRVKKVIVRVCKDKFTERLKNYTAFTGVSNDIKDQFYSEIYSFLISQYQKVLEDIIQQKKEDLQLTFVDSARIHHHDIQRYIQQRVNETEEQAIIRLTKEAENLRNLSLAQQLFAEAIGTRQLGQGLDLKFEYVKFCLRNNITSSSKLIHLIYEILQGNRADSQIILLYNLVLFASKKKNQCKQGWIFLRDLISQEPSNIVYLGLANLSFENFLVDKSLSQKYSQLSERVILRELGSLPGVGQHRESPHPSQLPTLKQPCLYNVQLKPEQRDEKIIVPLIDLLLKYNLFQFIELVIPRLNNQESPSILYISILVELTLEKSLTLNQKSPSYSLTKLITRISFESGNYQMCEQYLKKLFRFKQTAKDEGVYLQLASIYLNKGQLGNAKACLVKLLQLNNNNSAAWLMLGNVEFRLNNFQNAEGCLREANVLNPKNFEIWVSLCELYLKQQKMNIANTCLVNSLRLRNKKQFKSKQIISSYLSTAEFTNENDKQLAELMIQNLQSVQ